MENLKEYYKTHKKQILLMFSLLVLTVITCLTFSHIEKKYSKSKNKEIIASVIEKKTDESKGSEEKSSDEIIKTIIKVDIKGFVVNEGVYSLESDARVIDVINLAGGLKEEANTRYLNLSKKIHDEDIIIVNSHEEIEKMKEESSRNIEKEKTANNNIYCEVTNQACLTEDKKITSTLVENKKSNEEEKKTDLKTKAENVKDENNSNLELNTLVNINVDNKETLMSLNGIGESKAEKIIEYRNAHGAFKTIEEIKNVNGIGDAIYEKIKELITVQ